MAKLRAAVFLDRDGTLMKDADYPSSAAQVRPYKGAAPALRLLRKAGFKLVLVTNQSGIGRGYFGWKEFNAVQRELKRRLGKAAAWHAEFVCPHAPGKSCSCRKPAPGMLLAAKRRLGLDLKASFLIGDKTADMKCAERAGVVGVLVRTGKGGRDGDYKVRPAAAKKDILAAARWITTRSRPATSGKRRALAR